MVTGVVALCYRLYFIDTYFVEKRSLAPSGRRTEATPWNAVLGFVVIGIPCLWFTFQGRFSAVEPNNKGRASEGQEVDEKTPPTKPR